MCFRFFSGQVYFEPRLPCDPAQISRFRRVLGEAGVEQLLKTTSEAVVAMGAVKKTEFERVIFDTTVQSKAIAHPTDSRLLEVAPDKIARLAKRVGIQRKQTHEREGRMLRRRTGGYAHAKQFKRLRGVLKRQRTILGRLLRKARRKMVGLADDIRTQLDTWVQRAERIHQQRPKDKNKLYALHAPEAECIGKVQSQESPRVRCEGQPGRHAPTGADGGRSQFPRQPVRRPHAGRTDRTDQHLAAGHRREADDSHRRPGLQGRGQLAGAGLSHPPWQVQVAHARAAQLAGAPPSHRTADRPHQG